MNVALHLCHLHQTLRVHLPCCQLEVPVLRLSYVVQEWGCVWGRKGRILLMVGIEWIFVELIFLPAEG